MGGERKSRIFRGLTVVCAGILTLTLGANQIVNAYRSAIDMYTNTKSYEVITKDSTDSGNLFAYTVKDECSTTEKLVAYHLDLDRRIEEEGCVLLKNEGSALPLAQSDKLTLLGNCSYRP